jgi:peptidoglycan/xylan/chitin deacetylase (PgdA/CDA1 family)
MTGGAVPDQIRRVALMECRGQGQVVLGRFGSGNSTDLPPHARSGSERELSEACARPGITLGVHSWSHPNLSRLSGAELRDELVRPAEWLSERYPRTLTPWLAYPYGLHSREVRESSAAAGFRGGLQVTGGYFRNDGQDWFAAPRLNVAADVSHEGFVLRMAGVFGR